MVSGMRWFLCRLAITHIVSSLTATGAMIRIRRIKLPTPLAPLIQWFACHQDSIKSFLQQDGNLPDLTGLARSVAAWQRSLSSNLLRQFLATAKFRPPRRLDMNRAVFRWQIQKCFHLVAFNKQGSGFFKCFGRAGCVRASMSWLSARIMLSN